jgi:hypothetical protein
VSADRLGQVRVPAVAHLSHGHYVAPHGLVKARVVAGDPDAGIVTSSLEFLGRYHSGTPLRFDLPQASEEAFPLV